MIRNVIATAKSTGRKVGICGQAPSDHEGFAEMLVDYGIDSVSLNPDSVLKVRQRIHKHEAMKAGKMKTISDPKHVKGAESVKVTKHLQQAEAQ